MLFTPWNYLVSQKKNIVHQKYRNFIRGDPYKPSRVATLTTLTTWPPEHLNTWQQYHFHHPPLTLKCYKMTQSSSKIELEMMGCYPQDRCHLRSYFGVLENRRTQRAAVFSWNIGSIYITSREIETGLLTLSTNTFIPIFVGHERTELGRM